MVATPQQYRHYIYVARPVEPIEDATGGLIKQTPVWEFYGRGRYEDNGQGSTIKLDDGKTIVFAGSVYTRPGLGLLPIGTEIRVDDTPIEKESIRFEGMVVTMTPNYFNARIYVNQQ